MGTHIEVAGVGTRPRVGRAHVDLCWIPLGAGAGGGLVRLSGRGYEALVARRERRPRVPLYHSALLVEVADGRFAIEMAPVWSTRVADRGVVAEGPVGLRWLGRFRLFRYEVRRWHGGRIPDLDAVVGTPVPIATDPLACRRLLALVPDFPTATWGLDEQGLGEMWNSNSLTSWLLAGSGHDLTGVRPPAGGRAPGWQAGLQAALAAASR